MDDPGHGVNPVSYEDVEHPPDGDLGPMVNDQPNPFHNNPDYEGGSRSGAHGSRRFRRDRSHSKRKDDDDDDEDCGVSGCDDADSPGLSGSLGKTMDKRSERSPARSTPTPHPARVANPAALNGKVKAKRDRMCSAGGCVDSIEPSDSDPLKPTQPDHGAIPIPSTVSSERLHYRDVSPCLPGQETPSYASEKAAQDELENESKAPKAHPVKKRGNGEREHDSDSIGRRGDLGKDSKRSEASKPRSTHEARKENDGDDGKPADRTDACSNMVCAG